MNRPNLFIVGAPKCGTTFFYEKFKNHPQFFFPKIKELNFFSYDFLKKESYYKDYKVNSNSKYFNSFKESENQKFIVDASVSYFTYDQIPKKIKDFNPDSKIIIMYRDPYKRAYSHYLMDKRMGHANEDLNYYLEDSESFHYRQYVRNSMYFENYRNYEKAFGKENILTVELEKLESEIEKIFDFLDIDFIDIDFNDKVNKSKVSKNFIGNFFLKNRGITERIKLIFPTIFLDSLKKHIYKDTEKNNIQNNSDNPKLKELLEEDFTKFKSII